MRASTKSKMFPRVQASDRRGSIVRRSFPLYNAIPQKIDIPEEKPVCSQLIALMTEIC